MIIEDATVELAKINLHDDIKGVTHPNILSTTTNSFTPDPIQLFSDKINNEYNTIIENNNHFHTIKTPKNLTKTLKETIEREYVHRNESIHTYKEPKVTFDTYVKLSDIAEYDST